MLLTGAYTEAVSHLHRHLAYARRALASLPPFARVTQWGFVQRQLAAFAELLQAPPLSQTEQPATLLAAAANAGVRQRLAWASYCEALDKGLPAAPPLACAAHIGQLRREPPGPNVVTDAELEAWLVHAEEPALYSSRNLELLSRAHTLLQSNPCGKHRRVMCTLQSQMADEHMAAGASAAALKLLQSVADAQRSDRWPLLLTETLQSLRECAGRLSLSMEHRSYSIELGASMSAPALSCSSDTRTPHALRHGAWAAARARSRPLRRYGRARR